MAYFERPGHPLQRRYEALRAIFVDDAPVAEVARRFEYKPASLHVLCSRFRSGDLDPFLSHGAPGVPARGRPGELRKAVLAARRRGLSIMEIPDALAAQGLTTSEQTAYRVLREAGVPRLPQRTRTKRETPASLPTVTADASQLDLSTGRTVASRTPLVFLFAPLLAELRVDELVKKSGFPGSSRIPARASLRSMLALKLLNRPRNNHVAEVADDEGFGLFASLNVLPKTTALSTYSYRVGPTPIRGLLEGWTRRYAEAASFPSRSFNFDFHTIRHYGNPDQSRLEKNYVPRRSQSVPSVLTAFAQEHKSRALVYANANLANQEKEDEVVAFAKYWRRVAGELPKELVFDAKATTHKGLATLDRMGIKFVTLRERRPKEIARLTTIPDSGWERVKLDTPDRTWRTPLVVDEHVNVQDYPRRIRQVAYKDLGREEPTLLLTNHTRLGPAKLLERYAQRVPIENSIAEQVGFLHVDALSSDVRLKVELDVVLSVIASNAHHWLGRRLKGYESATAATLWRTFLDRPGHIRLTGNDIILRVRRFAKAPVLIESPVWEEAVPVPWLGARRIRLDLL